MDVRMQNYLNRINRNKQKQERGTEQYRYGFVAEGPPPVNEQPKKNNKKKKRVG